ncbi:MAG: hypothetical protein ACLFVE_15910 [Chitinispirillaceae bacterium]
MSARAALFFTAALLFFCRSEAQTDDTALVSLFAQEFWDRRDNEWVISEQVITQYDDQNRETSISIYEGTDGPQSRIIVTYPDDVTIVRTFSDYDLQSDTWVISYRRILIDYPEVDTVISQTPLDEGWLNERREIVLFNASGDITERHFSSWRTGEWIPQNRFTYNYNRFGKQTLFLHERWAESLDLWEDVAREVRNFGSDSLVDSTVYQTFEGGTWGTLSLRTFSYFSPDRLAQITLYGTNPPSPSLQLQERTIFSYPSANGKMLEISVEQRWMNEWVNNRRIIDTIDALGRLSGTLVYSWSNGEWQPRSRTLYSYDQFGNLLTMTEQSFNETNDWENVFRNRYEYTYTEGTGIAFQNKSVLPQRTAVSIAGQVVKISGLNASVHHAKMIDLKGRTFRINQFISTENKFSFKLQHIPAGCYFLHLTSMDGTEVWSGKLVLPK